MPVPEGVIGNDGGVPGKHCPAPTGTKHGPVLYNNPVLHGTRPRSVILLDYCKSRLACLGTWKREYVGGDTDFRKYCMYRSASSQ